MTEHSEIRLFDLTASPDEGKPVDDWYRSLGYLRIAGVDEAGRGALAGPVCAAAVVFGKKRIEGLNDSKALKPEAREALLEEILDSAVSVGVAFVSPERIDGINILRATLEAMRLAVGMLLLKPDLVLVDGDRDPVCGFPTVALVGGDRRSESIMAASIVAKVYRDRYMTKIASQYPAYGFDKHKGYSVPMHLSALSAYGVCPIHRLSFAPCREALDVLQNTAVREYNRGIRV